ncbi:hypothetical protein E2562_029755 [Oryza meyeriana var. granulata]|uniref:DRBM domain-containing protein n=1 Tax=Oryza meyeriana var. granulata TaxID=110450 RepID=A0A6G1CHX3_9ORYZ|nr:hypothetical protein E2562_029755 [Oryza meyeriana var. granulata]
MGKANFEKRRAKQTSREQAVFFFKSIVLQILILMDCWCWIGLIQGLRHLTMVLGLLKVETTKGPMSLYVASVSFAGNTILMELQETRKDAEQKAARAAVKSILVGGMFPAVFIGFLPLFYP